MRANYPKFSPDNKTICFVAHSKSTTQLYKMDLDGKNIKQLTRHVGDIQIITPSWSPDGESIVFSQSDENGLMDIYVYNLKENSLKKLTSSREADYLPIWDPDGQKISFTGLYDYTPNLYTLNIASGEIIQNTDVGDIVVGTQWNNITSTITALTLSTVDTSRVVEINPERSVIKNKININPKFSSWRNKTPDHPLLNINLKNKVEVLNEENYKFYKNITHTGTQTTTGQLNVDNIRIDGNVISATSGAITLTPAAGQNVTVSGTNTNFTAAEIHGTLGEFTTLRTDKLEMDTSDGDMSINTQGTGTLDFNTPTQTTIGSAGGASALPGAPTGYLKVKIAGTLRVIPFWDQA